MRDWERESRCVITGHEDLMNDNRPSYGSSHYTNISLMLGRNFDILLEEKKAREFHERAWCEIGNGLPDSCSVDLHFPPQVRSEVGSGEPTRISSLTTWLASCR
jgi:hypothetical protein